MTDRLLSSLAALAACAVTASDNGETGRIVGSIGIGAPARCGCHVARLSAFFFGASMGDSRGVVRVDAGGDKSSFEEVPMKDFLNHDGREDNRFGD